MPGERHGGKIAPRLVGLLADRTLAFELVNLAILFATGDPAVTRNVLSSAVVAAVASVAVVAVAPQGGRTHRISVRGDGSFMPASLRIRDGDMVEWSLPDRTSSIVAATGPVEGGACPMPRPFVRGDVSNFTGPMPVAASGIFVMSPLERATMDETWSDPNATGVFIRLLWNRTHVAPGTEDSSFDFTELDREIEQAVRNGKVYSLGFKAGTDGTPEWIFSTPARGAAGRGGQPARGRGARGGRRGAGAASPDIASTPAGAGGVTRLTLQETLGAAGRGCGQTMDLGSPTDPMYQKHYFDLLTKVAAHIRSRSDWYRALAYFKPSGANLVSHENRLPKTCEPGCTCNPQVFAQAGYTPTKLYDFYRQQFDLLARELPGKSMAYALIQDGFPSVNDSGGWEQSDGRSSNNRPLPGGVEQTEAILAIGQRDHASRFVVQHNGLQPAPPRGTCPNQDRHPARPPYARIGTGCPNRWVLRAGSDGRTVTGYQTTNAQEVDSPAAVESALQNAWTNSDASFVEIYEERFREATRTNGGRLPGGRTLADWANRFHDRRRTLFRDLGDPFPTTHRFRFRLSSSAPSETMYYFDPATCRRAPQAHVGSITIER